MASAVFSSNKAREFWVGPGLVLVAIIGGWLWAQREAEEADPARDFGLERAIIPGSFVSLDGGSPDQICVSQSAILSLPEQPVFDDACHDDADDTGRDTHNGCDALVASVDTVSQQKWRALTPRVVDYDRDGVAERGWQAWAIVKFDWDFPPFLQAIDQTTRSRPVWIGNDGNRLTYRYLYAQRNGVEERGSTMAMLRVGATADCGEESAALSLIATHGPSDDAAFDPPDSFIGKVVVRVVPKTMMKSGRPYYSEVLSFTGNGHVPVFCNDHAVFEGEPTTDQLDLQGYYPPGKTIDFRSSTWEFPYFAGSWSKAEDLGRWSIDNKSIFYLKFQNPIERPLHLTARVLPFVLPAHPKQTVTVLANNRIVANWTFDQPGWTTVSADIPAENLAGSTKLEISVVANDLVSPVETGTSVDRRRLKLLFQTVTFD